MRICLILLLVINTIVFANNVIKPLDDKTKPKEREVNIHELKEILPDDAEQQMQKLHANTNEDKFSVKPVQETIYINYLDRKIELKDIVKLNEFLKLKKRVLLLEDKNKIFRLQIRDLNNKYKNIDAKIIQIIDRKGNVKRVKTQDFKKQIKKQNKIIMDKNGVTREVFKDDKGSYYIDEDGNKVYLNDKPYKEVYVDEDGNVYDVMYDENGKAYIMKDGKREYLDENRKKYIQTPDGKIREIFKDDKGSYYIDEDGNKVYLNDKRYIQTPDGKIREVFKDDKGSYYIDEDGNKVYLSSEKLKPITSKPKEVYIDEDGNVYDVMYDENGKAYIIKDGKREYLDENRKKYVKTLDGKIKKVLNDEKGSYFLDVFGNRVYIEVLKMNGDLFGKKRASKARNKISKNEPNRTIINNFRDNFKYQKNLDDIDAKNKRLLSFYTRKQAPKEPVDDKLMFVTTKDMGYVATFNSRLKEAKEAEAKAFEEIQNEAKEALAFKSQIVTGECTVGFTQTIEAFETSSVLICETEQFGKIRLYGKFQPSVERYYMPFVPTSFTTKNNEYFAIDTEVSYIINLATGNDNMATYVNPKTFDRASKIATKEVFKAVSKGVKDASEDLREYGKEKTSSTSDYDKETTTTTVIKPDLVERVVYSIIDGGSVAIEKIIGFMEERSNWIYIVEKNSKMRITLKTKEVKK